MLLGSRFHPVWTMVAAAVLVTSGLGLLFGDLHAVAVGLVVYGAGNGLTSIVRGTLPLALFGAEGYATLMGRIGRPVLIALALAPSIAAVILDRYGATPLVVVLACIGAVNLVIGFLVRALVRSDGQGGDAGAPTA
jgi:hypothetical protein